MKYQSGGLKSAKEEHERSRSRRGPNMQFGDNNLGKSTGTGTGQVQVQVQDTRGRSSRGPGYKR